MALVWRRSGRVAYALAAGALAACGAFGASEGDAPPNDAGSDGGAVDAALDAPPPPPDAAGGDDADTAPLLRAVCPPPHYGPTVRPNALTKRRLYAPLTTPAYPFAIATDSANVYWLEQVASGADQAPYDGKGVARLVRVDRTGKTMDVLAAGQRHATALVLDGAYAYWTATEANGQTHLRRVPRTCASPCTPEGVAVAPDEISKLVRPRKSLLFAQAEFGGAYYRIDLSAATVAFQRTTTTTSDLPGLTATLDRVFVSSLLVPSITELDLQAAPVRTLPIPQQDDASPGVSALGNDCESLWAMRAGPDVLVRIVDGGVTPVTGPTFGGFEIVADDRYVYVAMPNAGGLRFYERQGGAFELLAPGNVWRVTVDDVGVYWGEHGGDGTIWMAVK